MSVTISVDTATGSALRWMVAQASGSFELPPDYFSIQVYRGNDLIFPKGNEYGAYSEPLYIAANGVNRCHGRTPHEARARCYVISKLGAKVEVPEEFLDMVL